MIYRILSVIICFFCFFDVTGKANAEIFADRIVSDDGSKIISSLAFLESFTEIDLSDDLRDRYNLVAITLSEVGKFELGSEDAKAALERADEAYQSFLSAYGTQLDTLREIADGSYDEIFKAIDWTSEQYAACVGYRGELLVLLKAAAEAVTATQNPDASLNDELVECEIRLNEASIKLDALIVSWEAEIDEKRKRVAELKEKHAAAVAAGDDERAAEIQSEIDQIEDEEIPELERKVQKSKKVKSSFSLEKLLKGLGKIALGIVSIIFSGECGEDAQKGCEKIGAGLIADGGKDIGEAFDPPEKTEYYEETEVEEAERDEGVVQREEIITEAVGSDPVPLCCNPSEIKPDLIVVEADEDGPLSFGYEIQDGAVSKIYLINNSDGVVLAEIDDARLFFKKGPDLPDLTTTAFSSLDRAVTQKTDGGTHLVKFEGTLVDGGSAALGVAVSPLTFSGKFKVTFRPAQ